MSLKEKDLKKELLEIIREDNFNSLKLNDSKVNKGNINLSKSKTPNIEKADTSKQNNKSNSKDKFKNRKISFNDKNKNSGKSKFLSKKRLGDTKSSNSNPLNKLNTTLESSFLLHSKAKTLYDKFSQEFNLEKNKHDQDFKWTVKMMEKGTFQDKLSALCQHIKKSPKKTLLYLAETVALMQKKNNRHTLICFEALKEIFLNSVLENKKYLSFIDYINYYKSLKGTNEIPDYVLIDAYIDDVIHKLYFSFLTSLENFLKEDNVISIKKQILNILQDMLKKKPEREEYLLDLLIYKLGDPKPEISNQAVLLLKNLQETHISMSIVLLKRLNSFINNIELANEEGSYHALVVIGQFKHFKNIDFVKYGLNMFFKLFNSYIDKDEEKYYKFLEQIIKSIGFFYKSAIMLKQSKGLDVSFLNRFKTLNFSLKKRLIYYLG